MLCTHYGPLQCFSTYFRKLKEIEVLRPIFPDYVISCNYVQTKDLFYIKSYFLYKNIFIEFPVLKDQDDSVTQMNYNLLEITCQSVIDQTIFN